jgi:hypothetical protein
MAKASGKISSPDTVRPYRLWDTKNKCNVRWRCYVYERNAHTGALTELWWHGKLGDSYEVYDAISGRSLGTYTKRVQGVGFLGPKDLQSRLNEHEKIIGKR